MEKNENVQVENMNEEVVEAMVETIKPKRKIFTKENFIKGAKIVGLTMGGFVVGLIVGRSTGSNNEEIIETEDVVENTEL